MGKTYDELTDAHQAFIAAQHVFFVATAPRSDAGHVNLSPKGLATFAILSPRSVAYLDYVGSGAETIAHLRENGRITILFCAFEGPPKILRLYGRGRVVEPGNSEFAALRGRFPEGNGVRSVIVADLSRVADSCGFGVPLMTYTKDRTQLPDWADRKGEDGVRAYQRDKNARSIDGLPALAWVDADTTR
ncbi:MAG: pyridoxamine 5'-phosphate oxidase family protein [Phycisphaerae bacterium]|nr:pyridoxamine 5'-phosphate oxidase family protein [Phycisphaerae bacterium]